jgi:hypothetical protein
VAAAGSAVLHAVPPQITAAAAECVASGGSPGAAAAIAALILSVEPLAALFLGSSGKEGGGMDEWASLAAKEGVEEPMEMRTYNPKFINTYFSTRPVTAGGVLRTSTRPTVNILLLPRSSE